MQLIVDNRWVGDHGIGRFATEVLQRLPATEYANLSKSPVSPTDVFRLSWKLACTDNSIWFSPGYNAPLVGLNRYVFVIHDLNHIDTNANSSILKRAYYRLIMKPGCRKAARVLTVSEFSRKRIIDWSGVPSSQVVNVGNGVSPYFHPDGVRYTPGFRYLLCVGNRKPHKNEERLLRAFASAEIAPDIFLAFTGMSNSRLEKLAQDLGVKDKVKFLGRIPDGDLPSIYRGALALVFPSLYEGFGLPVIEAMAVGTPVLTSTFTSLPEVAGDAAILVDPLDEKAIATGIQRILQDESLRETLINRGYRQAAKYTWNNVAAKVATVLEEVTTTLEKK